MQKRGKARKGQIALWVIVALIIIAAGVAAYLLFPDFFRVGFSKQKAQEIMFEQSENLRDSVAYCISEAVKYCLNEIGKRGGYYYVSDLWYVDFAGPKYVVVYRDEQGNYINKLPSLDRILGESLNNCMNEEGWARVDDCVNLDSFKKFFNVEELKDRIITVTAGRCNVYINISWPMKLSKTTLAGKVEQKIEQKDVTLPLCLKEVWEVANDIVNMEVNDKDWANNADEYIRQHSETLKRIDIQVQHYPTYKQVIFMLKSIPYRIKEEPYPFYFVIVRESPA